MRFLSLSRYRRVRTSPRSAVVLSVTRLEARDVPSATVLDLTMRGVSATFDQNTAAGAAWFTQAQSRPAGTGVIDSFVRVQALGNSTVEAGYNTDARPLAYDENKSPQFTRSLRVTDTPVWTDPSTGTRYREFLLDINQKASAPLLSLNELRVYVGSSSTLHGSLAADGSLPGATLAYDMGAGNSVALDARLSTGSGSSDMVLDVPEQLLMGGDYLYLYSKFGATGGNYAANGGFEEWAVRGVGGGPIVSDASSISGTVYFNGSAVPDGTVVRLMIGSTIVDEATTVNGAYTFNNLLLDGATSYTVLVPATVINDTPTADTSAQVSLAPGEHKVGVDLNLEYGLLG
ncbi:MAG: hypothetical protein K8U57_31305 [Planctomycetes bacterium]|nr:hypothetical protein [Planctomycetota bacterium]